MAPGPPRDFANLPNDCATEPRMSLDHIASDNRDCLVIYNELLGAHRRCGSSGAGYLNLASLFFHDLMKILTGFTLRRSELESATWAPDPVGFQPQRRLPYVGYQDLLGGMCLEEKDFAPSHVRWGRKRRAAAVLSAVCRPFLRSETPHAALGFPAAVDTLQLWRSLRSHGATIGFSSPGAIPIPTLEPQLLEITRSIESIFARLALHDDPGPLKELIRRHIRARVEEGQPRPPEYDVLITGTLMKLEDRGAAAVARAAGVPVVSVMHGDQFGAYDEPHIGYGELTYASAFVGYGRGDAIGFDEMEYGRSLFDQPAYIPSDSSLVRKRFRDPWIRPLGALDAQKVMYVPNSLKGQTRYGPFHDIPDVCYVAWYRTVLAAFPNAILKLHPKSAVDPRGLGLQYELVMGGSLQDCLDVPDVFVIDSVSTAFALAAATDKPIVYCDIGLRNLSSRGKRAIQDRCLWIEADPWLTSAAALLEGVDEQRDVAKHNSFSAAFSLAGVDEASRRVDVVGSTAISLI